MVASALPAGTAATTVHRGPLGRWGGPRCHSRLVRGAWASTEWHSLGNLRTAQRRSGTAVDAGLLAALMTSRDRVASVILTTGWPLIS